MYLLVNSTNLSEIGRYPQVKDSNIYKESGTQIFGDFLSILDKKFNKEYLPIINFRLHLGAKLTDFIEMNNSPLINEKLLKIFLESNIENYQYFEVSVFKGKKEYKYYLFYIYGQNYDLVDYKNMIFYGENYAPYSDQYREPHEKVGTQKKVIKVEQAEQLVNWQKLYPDFPNMIYDNLKLNYANIQDDMIRLPFLLGGFFMISENLRNKILVAKCTGVTFRTKDWNERNIL